MMTPIKNKPVVIDLGSFAIRAGFAGEQQPRHIIRSAQAGDNQLISSKYGQLTQYCNIKVILKFEEFN